MKKKHIPERTCIACRVVRSKWELVRVVRLTTGEVVVDESGKRNGRGAYLCRNRACWEHALKHGMIGRTLRKPLTPEERAALAAYAATLPLLDPHGEQQK